MKHSSEPIPTPMSAASLQPDRRRGQVFARFAIIMTKSHCIFAATQGSDHFGRPGMEIRWIVQKRQGRKGHAGRHLRSGYGHRPDGARNRDLLTRRSKPAGAARWKAITLRGGAAQRPAIHFAVDWIFSLNAGSAVNSLYFLRPIGRAETDGWAGVRKISCAGAVFSAQCAGDGLFERRSRRYPGGAA
jgi:hypothetical protein